MTLSSRLYSLVGLTLADPRRAVRALLDEDVPLSARTMGLLFIAVALALLGSIDLGSPRQPLNPLMEALTASPFRLVVLHAVGLAVSVALIHAVGRAFGGTGALPDAILITVWLQFLMLGLQVLQLAAFLLAPQLAGLIALGSFGLFVWLIINFIAELHGFRSRMAVFVVMLLSLMATGFVLSFVVILLLGPEVLTPYV